MIKNANPNYFRLGVFVLSAIGVLIAIILIFGGGRFFKPSFTVETYVKQSVTGLDVGAPALPGCQAWAGHLDWFVR